MTTAVRGRTLCIRGSNTAVVRVYAYDPRDGLAAVVLRSADGAERLDLVSPAELEATDAAGTLYPVAAELRRRAGANVINGEG